MSDYLNELRDRLALKAMESLIPTMCDPTCSQPIRTDLIAKIAYEQADEMIKARQKPEARR